MTLPSIHSRVILGSHSPRRRELLGLVVPPDAIEVLPPRETGEASFDGLDDLAAIERRLTEIAWAKCDDVIEQVLARNSTTAVEPTQVLIAADTVIVVNDASGRPLVLGQPPEDDTWTTVVRHWFRDYYAGQTHLALTALCVGTPGGATAERLARSEVTFRTDVERWLDWYLATGEPRGKAGGYAIQGAGSVFISHVAGSLSNVIGLPLEALLDAFEELGVR